MSATDNAVSPLDSPSQTLIGEESLKCPSLRWGILGCGRVSHDFVQALKLVPTAQVVACAARDGEAAKGFAEKHDIGNSCEYYGINL